MSSKYIPLYTKYRPMVFADITGQENTVKALSNAIKTGRIMHAYLFCGPRGTGKTSSARIFAKSLNCENGPTVTPCGKCPGCLDVVNSTPVDVIEIDAASNRSVEDARNILEKVQYAPLHGKYKIYIIDEVHMLTSEASNTLLKTLEEPPENVIFILATTESHKVLETIVSRCQRYDFKRITTSDIVKRLSYIAKEEKIKINDEALLAIAKNAAGGMRDAVALLDQLSVLGQNDTITVNDVNEILGQVSYEIIYDIVQTIKNNDTENALKKLNSIYDRGNEPSRILTTLIQYFRDLLIVKSCSDKNIVYSITKINEAIYEKTKTQSDEFDNQTIIYFIEKTSEYFTKIKENTNKFMWAELCLIDLTSSPKIPTLAELSEKVAELEQKINSGSFAETNDIPKIKKEIPKQDVVKQPSVENTPTVSEEKQDDVEVKIQPVQPVQEEEQTNTEIEPPFVSASTENSSPDEDMYAIWKQIIAETKTPAKFFFGNLAKPIEVNKHKIVIVFPSEGAVKQANGSKTAQLESAACKYFDVESIQIIIKHGFSASVSSDNSEKKKQEKKNEEIKTEKTETKPSAEKTDIKQHEEIKTVFPENDYDEEDFDNNVNLQNFDEAVVFDTSNLSDTANNILTLFDGKITNL